MRRVIVLFVVGSAVAPLVASQKPPAELTILAAKAKLNGTVTAWCRAEFRPGGRGAFAVAVVSAAGGRYVALDSDGQATELAPFKGLADLSCYNRAEAQKLDRSISQSTTIHGQLTPRWNTTVVCGFIDDTSAECWQYSPDDRAFVKVGRWVT